MNEPDGLSDDQLERIWSLRAPVGPSGATHTYGEVTIAEIGDILAMVEDGSGSEPWQRVVSVVRPEETLREAAAKLDREARNFLIKVLSLWRISRELGPAALGEEWRELLGPARP